MQRFANWTNLSETTFVLPPEDPAADYRTRIFTPRRRAPVRGHPDARHLPRLAGPAATTRRRSSVQECGAGLVSVRRTDAGLAFAAPPLVRSGPVEDALLGEIAGALGIARAEIVDAQWADNGPGWSPCCSRDADAVLAIRAHPTDLDIGVVRARTRDGAPEVRAFFPKDGGVAEDPVTGSLNASLAQWLLARGNPDRALRRAARGPRSGAPGACT